MSMATFAEVEIDTGRILSVGACPAGDLEHQTPRPGAAIFVSPPQAVLETPSKYWLDGDALRPRPVLVFDKLEIAADGEDVATLSIPHSFIARIDGAEHEIDGTLEIASDMPATYRVEINHFPYRPLDVEITAA